jgi:diguanylate cyclase (GGDEF)-like protein
MTRIKHKIVILDDDIHVLHSLSRILHDKYDVSTSTSGLRGIQLINDMISHGSEISVVISDYRMPDIDGFTTIKKILKVSPLTVAIMLTGYADMRVIKDAVNNGYIFRFLEKPADQQLLFKTIKSAIQQHELLNSASYLEKSEERLRLALEAVGDGVWDWFPDTDSAIFTTSWWGMLNEDVKPEECLVHEWFNRVHPDDLHMLSDQIYQLRNGLDTKLHCEHRLRISDGTYKWFLARGFASYDSKTSKLRIIGTHTDIHKRHLMEETILVQASKLEQLANTDSLTGISNRRSIFEKLDEELHRAERYTRPLSVIMVDIDHFKHVNDQYGHNAGDDVLIGFCGIIKSALRKNDSFGRIGGEEFAIILPETTLENAIVVAELLRLKIEGTLINIHGEQQLQITSSFGATVALPVNDTINGIMHRADIALYKAKDGGRNRVMFTECATQ